jgi:hypothetical protein
MVPWFILLILIWVLLRLYNKRKVRQQISKLPALQGPQLAELNEEGLSRTAGTWNTNQKWGAFVSYLETENMFILYSSPSTAALLPKRAFASESDLAAARQLFAAKIGAVFPKTRT